MRLFLSLQHASLTRSIPSPMYSLCYESVVLKASDPDRPFTAYLELPSPVNLLLFRSVETLRASCPIGSPREPWHAVANRAARQPNILDSFVYVTKPTGSSEIWAYLACGMDTMTALERWEEDRVARGCILELDVEGAGVTKHNDADESLSALEWGAGHVGRLGVFHGLRIHTQPRLI